MSGAPPPLPPLDGLSDAPTTSGFVTCTHILTVTISFNPSIPYSDPLPHPLCSKASALPSLPSPPPAPGSSAPVPIPSLPPPPSLNALPPLPGSSNPRAPSPGGGDDDLFPRRVSSVGSQGPPASPRATNPIGVYDPNTLSALVLDPKTGTLSTSQSGDGRVTGGAPKVFVEDYATGGFFESSRLRLERPDSGLGNNRDGNDGRITLTRLRKKLFVASIYISCVVQGLLFGGSLILFIQVFLQDWTQHATPETFLESLGPFLVAINDTYTFILSVAGFHLWHLLRVESSVSGSPQTQVARRHRRFLVILAIVLYAVAFITNLGLTPNDAELTYAALKDELLTHTTKTLAFKGAGVSTNLTINVTHVAGAYTSVRTLWIVGSSIRAISAATGWLIFARYLVLLRV